MPLPTLKDQRVVVIGGSSGIGFAVAECAMAEGARVVIGSSSADKVDAAVARLGQGASGSAVDVREEASVAAFFERVGEIDHLVFTAGDWGRHLAPSPIDRLSASLATEGLKVRFFGPLLCIQRAQARLSPNGSITLTDGLLAHHPQKGAPLSAALGGAIEHLARGLAADLAPIRVNAVCPGLILTEHVVTQWPAEMIRVATERQPLPRAGDPAEVAQAYLYLMRGGYTTGQVIIVDGGAMLV
ncbi:MAG TPA: SDR family oxidoreductase [Caulobacteraceae bacterium]|jgi:NAD(P)-dependent dehydrogenase (short-subunit alcohol dehydrogenase family)|nr:SDR family oxidoreductase [Caulobacteraceae bacterium]